MTDKECRIAIDSPLWDQSTFIGRFKHFAYATDPRTVFVSERQLLNAKTLCESYKLRQEPANTTRCNIIYAKKLYSSAFHPDTGELQNVIGRMSFQVPGGVFICGGMIQFYRTIPAVLFWQFVNQSFNAIVNYTNRNAKNPISATQLSLSYVSATTSALIAAIFSKRYLEKNATPFMQRYVPLAAVIAANFVNIPLMRQTEITLGVDVVDENGNPIGKSRAAAVKGISQVIVSRIFIPLPPMIVLPLIMNKLEPQLWFKQRSYLNAPIQMLILAAFLLITVPVGCALFPQRCSIDMDTIKRYDKEFYEDMEKEHGEQLPNKVYFNKGL
ncbi:Sideroflexin-2 [Pseudolycoriella hygida]|uniref:Sidoreflexin n=1 Tax=Pseudolycoriella hygida TaxID=35572 RepID=A0A9Q0MWQ9_9DIPT|nr:Sideroflexin-2 [Pseudolycoriella hygida]